MERSTTETEPPPTSKPGDNKISQPDPVPGGPGQAAANQETLLSYALRHFVHNEITSVLILPLGWQVTSLNESIQQPRWDYEQDWQGELGTREKLAVGANLLVLAIGIGTAFRRWQFAGLTPLAIHLGYHASNAVSRTSGGRYLAPVDWVVVVYFTLGLLAVVYAVRGRQPTPPTVHLEPGLKTNRLAAVGAILGTILLGCAFLLADLVQPRYPASSAERLLAEQVARAPEWFIENGFPAADLEAFVNSQSGVVELGLILYPRYFTADEPAPVSSHLPVMPADENRIAFLLLEEFRPIYIRLALGEGYPAPFPHADYGLVVGCLMEGYIEGKLIIPLEDPQQKPILADRLSLTCTSP